MQEKLENLCMHAQFGGSAFTYCFLYFYIFHRKFGNIFVCLKTIFSNSSIIWEVGDCFGGLNTIQNTQVIY